MVAVVKDIIIPVKGGGGEPVFTIVCEVVPVPAPPALQEDTQPLSRIWKMASAWRVISFFLVVFVLPTVLISLPLYARYHLYHTRHLPMTETDVRALNDAVSSFWCQGQRVSSNGTLDAYLVPGTPKVVKKERRHVSLKRKLKLQHDDIEYWGVYLLEGSTFTLSSTARWPGAVLLVAKGEDNLRKCFYREEHLEAELNDRPPKTVYRSPPDVDDLPGEMAVEEEHHRGDTGGGEVFDEEEEDVFVANHRTKSKGNVEKDEGDVEVPVVVPRRKLGLRNKGPEAPKRRNGRGKKGKKGKKNRQNKNETHHHRSKRSPAQPPSLPSPPPILPDLPPSTPSSGGFLSNSKLNMLHYFNDTLMVTTGNSSFSSSEEFLEQCRDSIIVVELQPSLDWEWRIDTDTVGPASTWIVPVNATDYYYFIFTSDNSIEENDLGFHLDMERATYDISDPVETCRNATECVFPLSFTQTQSVVVEVPGGEKLLELNSFEVTTACQPRVPVYMVFIMLVPFIILLFAFQ